MNRSGLLLVAVSLAAAGCGGSGKTPYANQTDGGTAGLKVDPWEAAAKRLAKDTDPAAFRVTLAKLGDDLAARPDVPGPPGLTPDAEKALVALAGLSPEDVEVLRPSGFSGADAEHLAECAYLRDAGFALDPVGLPPAEKARAAFAWVCRQVYLRPWVTDDGRPGWAVPPTYVLRRGWGSGYERATVCVALFHQLGIDAGLVGAPDAINKPVAFAPPWAEPKTFPPGPFWAVAAKVGPDVLLFDPAGGRAFPGTLAQVKANPDLLKAWADDKAAPWRVPADVVKQATVFVTAPVHALAPRMAALDERTKAEFGVRPAVDLKALRDRFGDAKVWTPTGDPFAYPRVLLTFLPVSDGGTDRRQPQFRLVDEYNRSRMPREMFREEGALPRGVPQPALERLVAGALGGFDAAFLAPPSPRERIQRGQLQDATRFLSDQQDRYARGQEQVRNVTPEQIEAWLKGAADVYGALRRAEYPNDLQTQPNPPTDPQVAQARGLVEEFWKNTNAVAQAIVSRLVARAGLAEATYLLALAKHEEAERQQVRADAAKSPDAAAKAAAAWAEAANAWRACLDQSASAGAAGRAAHARTLADRASAMAAKKG